MHHPVGIRSLAISFPSVKRTNDYYREKYPEKVAQAEQETLAKVFSPNESSPKSSEFDQAMSPYLSDPFRGAVERYVLDSNESSLTLETRAAKEALKAVKLNSEDIDLMLVTSMLPDQIGIGNASFLVDKLSLSCPAWNIESMHSGALVGLQTAYAMVKSGEYRNVLMVVSCTYSRYVNENDTLSWIMGDAAGAFLVSSLESNQGILGTKIVNTSSTNKACSFEIIKDREDNPQIRLQPGKRMSKLLRENIVNYIHESCHGAIVDAEVTLEEIDFFVFNTPFAWFAKLFTRTLKIDSKQTLNLYSYYGNIGAALPIANLYYAAKLGKIHKNNLVLVFSMGGSSTAAATVMRWGDVALGSTPGINIPNLLETKLENKGLITC